MHPDLSSKAREKIEAICGLGCTQVNQLLKKADRGDEIEELSEFTSSEKLLIIDELNEIMSVYDDDSKNGVSDE